MDEPARDKHVKGLKTQDAAANAMADYTYEIL